MPGTGSYYPGTTNIVTHSFEERLMTAEFDDALAELAGWKNPRYEGSKLTAKKINKFTPKSSLINTSTTSSEDYVAQTVVATNTAGANVEVYGGDSSFQELPVLTNKTTALYLANTVIGGTEDEQFATIQEHSYVGIYKIILINLIDDSVQVLDKTAEPFPEFHRFITNDLPTGARCKFKVLDDSISTNLKPFHKVKMNKGYLLKSFSYKNGGDISASLADQNVGATAGDFLLENNSLYFYRSGAMVDNLFITGSSNGSATVDPMNNQLRFRYGMIEGHSNDQGLGSHFDLSRIGPSYASSSIHQNKFTQQFYSGSYGFLTHQPTGSIDPLYQGVGGNAQIIAGHSMGSASKFIGIDSLNFLRDNVNDSDLSQQEKTEIHITFFEGTKDFAPGFDDERSISTFEVDQNQAQLGVETGDHCMNNLPTHHEIVLKGPDDGRFMPTTSTFIDTIRSIHLEATASGPYSGPLDFLSGCIAPGVTCGGLDILTDGLTIDEVRNVNVYVQGGALGEIGYEGVQTASVNTYGTSSLPNMNSDNFYSGSFRYEISFLDKDHTIITDIDKDLELFDGIGTKGLLIIPDHAALKVKTNLEYYLNKAGIVENTTNILTNLSPDTYPRD